MKSAKPAVGFLRLPLLSILAWTASTAASARAQDHHYVLPDGTAYPLYKAEDEVGVIVRPDADVRAVTAEVESRGIGRVRSLPHAPDARLKIVRLTDIAGDIVAPELEAVEGIQKARPIYRLSRAGSPIMSSGEIVAKVRADLNLEETEKLWTDYGVTAIRQMDHLSNVYILRPQRASDDEVLLAERLAYDPRTEWANPDFLTVAVRHQVAVADELFHLQWHLHSTEDNIGAPDADIDAPEAWELATGTGVRFSMFDDGVDVDHEDLADNYIGIGQDVTFDFFQEEFNDPRPKAPTDAHGTAVMGLAVAAANTLGVRGVAFQGEFTATRGLGLGVSHADIASSYTFAMQQKVDIHINSWGFPEPFPNPPVIVEAIQTAAREGRDPDGPGPAEPRGMVIVFSTGNRDIELVGGLDLATIPEVLAVGATTREDLRAFFSDYGDVLDIMAPGGVDPRFGVTTTDTEDDAERVAQGYNLGGNAVVPGFGFILGADIDPNGSYTGFFGGTSAACPIAAGVAGLVLSVNPNLTAEQVKIILRHTADKVSPEDAQYDSITGRSLFYGYGRVNANAAVRAARDSLGADGVTWPGLPDKVMVDGATLQFAAGVDTDEFLILETNSNFDLLPEDGDCFDEAQAGCEEQALEPLPEGASVLFIGCDADDCSAGSEQTIEFERPSVGSKLFAIYARNDTGRYSFGTVATAAAIRPPSVTIMATPLVGESPLTVRFNGNATSDTAIDTARTEWDFDVDNLLGDNIEVNATTTSARFTYIVPAGQTQTFRARLTMYNVLGVPGTAEVAIRVVGPAEDPQSQAIPENELGIVAAIPGNPGSSVSGGTSPFRVELRIEANNPAVIESVRWDLGDGSPRASGLSVLHTYQHDDETARNFIVTAVVTMRTSEGTTVARTVSKVLTVQPGTGGPDIEDPNLPGTNPLGPGGPATPCGVLGMIPLLVGVFSLTVLRLRRR